ncbi:MAG: FAD:protein FMN transferase [Melioribacteraceae bacterium]|nr:FAD:protein FMN transferase [Melioribacteraceae bacterium]
MNSFFKILPLVFIILVSCTQNNVKEVYTLSGTTMGTTFSIKVVKESKFAEENYTSINSDVDLLLKEVNRQMSTYIPTSEISEFNKSESTDWIGVSEDFAFVVNEALKLGEDSEGYFDITIGALVNLWGFGPENRPTIIPTDEEIAERMKEVGFSKISVKFNLPMLKKSNPKMYIDLSAIAKGFGVDKVAEYFNSKGYKDYMVEIGGEVRTRGKNQDSEDWRIGISTPDSKMGIQKVANISNLAMATSGDYYNYFEKDDIRFSHTIDPKNGKPITHKLASVTVLHKSCAMADGIATAINVMGPIKGYEFALKKKLTIFMIVRENNKFIEKMSPEFKKVLTKAKVSE